MYILYYLRNAVAHAKNHLAMSDQSKVYTCKSNLWWQRVQQYQTFITHEKVTRPYISKPISWVKQLHESDTRPTQMSHHKSSGLCPSATVTLIPLKKPLTKMAVSLRGNTARSTLTHQQIHDSNPPYYVLALEYFFPRGS